MKSLLAKSMEKVSAIWNSIDSLGSLNFWAQVILAGFVLGTFFFTAVSLIATWRKEGLQRAQDLKKEEQIAATSQLAADANERAAKLEVTAEEAKAEQKRLDLQIETQRAENLKLQSQVEQERTERLKLQRRVIPRRLSDAQKSAFFSSLGDQQPSGVVSAGIFMGTDDGVAFGNDLLDVIAQAAGWTVGGTGQYAMGGQLSGLSIIVGDAENPPPRAVSLQRALKSIQFDAPIRSAAPLEIPLQQQDQVLLFVGPKP